MNIIGYIKSISPEASPAFIETKINPATPSKIDNLNNLRDNLIGQSALKYLSVKGINELYSHQTKALDELINNHQNLIVTTSTARFNIINLKN